MKKPEALPKLDLVGRWFHIFNADGVVQYQGLVRGKVDETRYLIQFCDWIMGELSTLSVISIDEMAVKIASYRGDRAWQFYEDNEHMNFWYEHYAKKEKSKCPK
jgi:hypothetical protein